MSPTLAVLATLLAALAPTPVVARGHRQNLATSQLHNLGQELFGSHFEWARGWVNGYPEDDEDHEVVDLGAASIAILGATQLQSLPNMTIPCVKITIPIIKKTIFDLIEPCGNVQVPVTGITFKTPFGSKTLAGVDELNQEIDAFDRQWGIYSGYAFVAVAVFYLLVNLAKTTKRQALKESFKKMASGQLDGEEPDPMMSKADKDQLAKDKLNPKSDKFICPGNIYRLVTILHPGVVGYSQWGKYCMKAGICAYMQLFLPFNIMSHCFRMWHFDGIKSPLYFVMNGSSFFLQFGALGNVVALFASKCAAVVAGDAVACHFILSHKEPTATAGKAAPASGEDSKEPTATAGKDSKVTPLLESAEKGQSKSSQGKIAQLEEKALKKIMPSQRLLDWNEYVWCLLNIFVTNVSAVMLMIAMYMKIATFSGDIINIALVTVSLYFVFDLDDKVMDSDPHLRGRFRGEVLKQTEATGKDTLWIKRSSSLVIGLIKASVPLGLLMIIVISWRQVLDAGGMALRPGEKFVIIGVDPFKQ